MLHMTRSTLKKITFSLFIIASYIIAYTAIGTAEETPKSVAVLPFEMHAPSSMAYLQDGLRDMLASRLAANGGALIMEHSRVDSLLQEPGKPLTREEAQELARQLGVDYIVTGSLTSLGGSMSLDAKVLSGDETFEPLNFYASATRENEVISAVNQLSWDMAARVFGAEPPAAQQAPAKTVPSVPAAEDDAMAAFKTEHPDKAYKAPSPAQAAGATSPIITPREVGAMQGFSKTQNLDLFLTGMDVGDIDGDGELDVVLADRRKISVYRLQNKRLIEFGSVEMPARSAISLTALVSKRCQSPYFFSLRSLISLCTFSISIELSCKFNLLFRHAIGTLCSGVFRSRLNLIYGPLLSNAR